MFQCKAAARDNLKEVTTMQEKMHPTYEDTTITCACGNVIHTRSTKKDIRVETFVLKFVPNVIRSLRASRSWLIQVDVLTDSRSASVLSNSARRLLICS